MARTRSSNWRISSPGRLPDRVFLPGIFDGRTIDLAEVQLTSSIPTLLYGENAELNAAIYTDSNGQDHAIGTVIVFDLIALADIEPKNSEQTDWSEDDAHRLYIRYKTDDAPDEQALDYEKIVEVFRRLPSQ
jgi:hypothetical protein